MIFNFKHIDDYELIISREAQKGGRDFRALIDKHFSEKDDLIFCLLEMVTLSDLDAIGETYLYSTSTQKESKTVLDKYRKIVNKVFLKFNKSIAEYLDWYKRCSYILMNSNLVEYSLPFQTPNWEQEPSTVKNSHDRSKFGKQIENHLSDQEVQEYLQYYATLLHEELDFKTYPHYCIIVRPVSVIEGKDVIPLGNLFLHFATLNEREKDFYLRLINDMLIVWFKRKGVKIIREIEKAIKEDEKCKASSKSYLPNFSKLHAEASIRISRKFKLINYSLEDYYEDLFNDVQKYKIFTAKCNLLKEKVIPRFIELREFLKNGSSSNITCPEMTRKLAFSKLPEELGYFDRFFGIQGKSFLSQKYDLEHFQKTLLRREFFKLGFLIFEIEPHILRNILMDPTDIFHDSQSADSDYTYLWTEMFIPWAKTNKISDLKDRIVDSLSSFEKEYLEICKIFLSQLQILNT